LLHQKNPRWFQKPSMPRLISKVHKPKSREGIKDEQMKGTLDILIEYQLRTFASDYVNASREVFYDQVSDQLIHPGEFGGLRESLVRNLLRNFLPESFGVSEGFIIAPNGDTSSQCDVVVYSRHYCSVIQTGERQRFFPVEAVVAVGEVKTNADSTLLRGTLENLVKERSGPLFAPNF
jgi:hypothetical protein